MKHIARRLLPYANDNKVIHADNIKDTALRIFAEDRNLNYKIRESLKEIDTDLELLIPYQVDDHEKQLKRYIQDKMGLVVNLSELYKTHPKHYRLLLTYGSPIEVIKKWGLNYTYGRNIGTDKFSSILSDKYPDGKVKRLYTEERKLYLAIRHQAKKESLSIGEYLDKLGFVYETD